MGSPFRDLARTDQGSAYKAMPDHTRDCRSLLLGEHQEIGRKITTDITIECHKVCDPKAVKDCEYQLWIFGSLSDCLCLFDQQTCLLRSRLGFGRCITFDMDEWSNERDLKFDLLTAQRRGRGQ